MEKPSFLIIYIVVGICTGAIRIVSELATQVKENKEDPANLVCQVWTAATLWPICWAALIVGIVLENRKYRKKA